MSKDKHPPRVAPPAKPVPAKPPPDDPLRRGLQDEFASPDEARAAALARLKALEEAQRMEKQSENQ